MQSRTGCTCLIFLKCAFIKCLLKFSPLFDAKMHWSTCFFFSMCFFQMAPQILSLNWCKVALFALVWFFSIFTMVTLLGFFKLCVFKYLLKLVAWIDESCIGRTCLIFLHCAFLKCLLKLLAWIDTKLYWLHLFDFFNCAFFKCLHKLSVWNDVNSHWSHLFDFSPLCVFKMPADIVSLD